MRVALRGSPKEWGLRAKIEVDKALGTVTAEQVRLRLTDSRPFSPFRTWGGALRERGDFLGTVARALQGIVFSSNKLLLP